MDINILLVDDHKIIRDGLSAILQVEDDMHIIAEAGNGQEALEKVRQYQPDVVVMDLTLPDMGGVLVTRQLLSEYPAIKVLMLTMFLDDNCVFESLEAGARGYLVKDCAAEELVVAIRAINQGNPYFCTGAQEIMMRKCLPGASGDNCSSNLTNRETEVLTLTARGLSTKEIAFELRVSVKMIEVHRSNIRKKLGISSIAQLTTYALKNGLIAS
jgi:DNA-binding NarL/FixJ family response regulator